MEHKRAMRLLSPLIDSALGPIARLRVQHHVAGCDACAARLEELRAMQAAFRTKLPYHRAPPGLAARIGAALPREDPMPALTAAGRRRWLRMPAIGMAGSGLVGALAGVALMLLVSGGQSDTTMDVIDAQIRSMQAQHLTDVQTSDQHTVKPWLSARLNVSPPVRDLKDEGFPLIGGRLDYIDGHPAAAVVYQRAKHVINLFAWASPGADEPFKDQSHQGFNVVTWRQDGIRYYAVSDVEADQLAQFARLVWQGS